MDVIDIPIVGQSYHLKDWAIDCQRTLNLYPQVVESGNAPQVSALLPTEGLTKLYEFTGTSQQYNGKIRGLYALTDRVLVVVAMRLIIIQNNVWRDVGYVRGLDPVTFADNGLEVFITGDDAYTCAGFVYNIAQDNVKQIDPDTSDKSTTGFFGASSVTFLDSRYVWSVPNSGKIQWSDVLKSTTTALSYATAESKSDNLVRVVASNGQLWLIGEVTTEIWNSTGSNDSPFIRQSGAYLPVGCGAKNTICNFGSSLIWLAQNEFGGNQIVMTQGYQTQRISNHALESEFNHYDKTSDAYAFSYQRDGHSFYVISFPTAKKTWCYDASTQLWHERGFYNTTDSNVEHHRVSCHCYFKGQHLVGDREVQKIYLLDAEAQTDDGITIVRERTTPCVSPQSSRLIFDALSIICQVGQDNLTRPQIMLDWSDDKGKTWSNDRVAEIASDLGAIGQYEKRVIFRRLGQSTGRVFRLRMTDAGRLILLGAKARVRT